MVVLLTPDLAVWVSSVAQGYCAAFLEKTCYSHGASLHQGVLIGNGELLVRGGGESLEQFGLEHFSTVQEVAKTYVVQI